MQSSLFVDTLRATRRHKTPIKIVNGAVQKKSPAGQKHLIVDVAFKTEAPRISIKFVDDALSKKVVKRRSQVKL